MKVFRMKLKDTPYKKMKSGRKTIELRLYDQKRRSLNIGDYIIFTNLSDENQSIAVKVTALHRYASFLELLCDIPPEKCGNEIGTTPEIAAEGMRKYYSEEQERLYGVLGIGVEVTNLDEVLVIEKELYEAMLEHYFPDGVK